MVIKERGAKMKHNPKIRKYSVKEFSAMVGMPYSSLRYFERINLLKPKKQENNYRSFTHLDAFILNRFKFFRSLGLTVDDSLDLIEESNVNSVIKKLDNRECEIKKEILKLQEQIIGIENTRKNLEYVKNEENKYEIKFVKDKVFIPASKGLDFTISKYDVFSKFVEMLPISEYCSRIKNRYIFDKENIKKDYGISIDLDVARERGIDLNNEGEILKMGKCLVYYINQFNKNDKFIEFIEDALEYIKEKNMEIIGDIYFNGIKLKYEDGSKGFLIYIPIK